MNISTIDNTLQNYITKYIEQTFAAHVLGNRYDKLYRKLLSGIEEIIKLAVNEAKHYDENLEDLYNDSRFNKKFIQAVAKHQVSEFLNIAFLIIVRIGHRKAESTARRKDSNRGMFFLALFFIANQ